MTIERIPQDRGMESSSRISTTWCVELTGRDLQQARLLVDSLPGHSMGIPGPGLRARRRTTSGAISKNIVLAQQILRHKSVGTTQTYLHPSMDDLNAALEAMDASPRN